MGNKHDLSFMPLIITILLSMVSVQSQDVADNGNNADVTPVCKKACLPEEAIKVIVQSKEEIGKTNVLDCAMTPLEDNLEVSIGDNFYMHSIGICPDDKEQLWKMVGVIQMEDDKVVNALENALSEE